MLNIIVEIISGILILTGLGFAAIGILGLYKMPDVYTKQHSIALVDGAGAIFLFSGLALSSGSIFVALKTLAIGFFILVISAPITYAFMQIVIRKDKPVVAIKNQTKEKETEKKHG